MYEKEKLKLKCILESASSERLFSGSDGDSAFKGYSESAHIQDTSVLEYDSREISEMIVLLKDIWENDEIKKQIIPIIVSSLSNSGNTNENRLPTISGRTYMM